MTLFAEILPFLLITFMISFITFTFLSHLRFIVIPRDK